MTIDEKTGLEYGVKTGDCSIEVVRVLDEKGDEIKTPFNEIDEKLFPTEEEYVDVIDMEFDSSLITSSEYAEFLAFKKHLAAQEAAEEGGLSFHVPKKISWGVIGICITVAIQLLVGGTILYNSQQSFNARTLERLEEVEQRTESVRAGTYSKQEEDLKYENLRLEIAKHKELLEMLRGDMRRSGRGSF